MLNCYVSEPFRCVISIQPFKLIYTQHEHNYHKWHRALVYVTGITIQFPPRTERRAKTRAQKSILVLDDGEVLQLRPLQLAKHKKHVHQKMSRNWSTKTTVRFRLRKRCSALLCDIIPAFLNSENSVKFTL